jgi:hypothetical protein
MKINNLFSKIALILIISASMVLNIFLLSDELLHFKYNRKDSIDERFKELKIFLPSKGIVGYVSDIKETEENWQQKSSLKPYYCTQYALSPLIVDNSPNHLYVVGNILTKDNQNSIIEKFKHELILIKDFGNGVVLFKRKG